VKRESVGGFDKEGIREDYYVGVCSSREHCYLTGVNRGVLGFEDE
jgi:hypothetical protein